MSIGVEHHLAAADNSRTDLLRHIKAVSRMSSGGYRVNALTLIESVLGLKPGKPFRAIGIASRSQNDRLARMDLVSGSVVALAPYTRDLAIFHQKLLR